MAIAGGDLTARNDILRTMNEEQGFRKTGTTGTAVGTNNIPSDASPSQTDDFSMLEPREQLRRLIAAEMEASRSASSPASPSTIAGRYRRSHSSGHA